MASWRSGVVSLHVHLVLGLTLHQGILLENLTLFVLHLFFICSPGRVGVRGIGIRQGKGGVLAARGTGGAVFQTGKGGVLAVRGARGGVFQTGKGLGAAGVRARRCKFRSVVVSLC